MGLPPAEQAHVNMLYYIEGTQTAMMKCLQIWIQSVFEARGLELELAHRDLEAINSHYWQDQLKQVLAKSLNRGEATWRQLSEALYSVPVGETALAKQVRMEHCRQGWLFIIQSGVHEGE